LEIDSITDRSDAELLSLAMTVTAEMGRRLTLSAGATPTATPAPASTAAPALLSAKAVALRLQISTATLWRMRRRGQFPTPITVGKHAPRWSEADVIAWEKSAKRAA